MGNTTMLPHTEYEANSQVLGELMIGEMTNPYPMDFVER